MLPSKRVSMGDGGENTILTALVTGGTGLIGRQVVARLKSLGMKVTTISLDSLKVKGADHHI